MLLIRPTSPLSRRSQGLTLYGAALVVAVIALVFAGLAGHGDPPTARVCLLLATGLFWALVWAGLGRDVNGSVLGVLVSGSNRLSLSRLQMALWTWLLLSALMAAAISRATGLGQAGIASAFDITIGPDLFAVMGISLFTGAASPALLALKSQDVSNPVDSRQASARAGETLIVHGKAVARPLSAPPKIGDLVKGDEVTSAGSVDLSKVQQLMVTVILAGVYAAMLFGLFSSASFDSKVVTEVVQGASVQVTKPIATVLPEMPLDMVKLLLLSHAGYLGYKAAPKPAGAVATPEAFAGPPPTPDRTRGGS